MKKIFLIFCFTSFYIFIFSETLLEYVIKYNNRIKKIFWQINEQKDYILIYNKTQSKRESIKSKRNIGTLNWILEDKLKQVFIKAERYKELNKDFIKISGYIKGEKIEKKYELNNKVWIQNFIFEFKDFILSEENQKEFVYIRVKDIEPVIMRIEKKEIQEKILFKKKIEVIKAEIYDTNILSGFVKNVYWFRKKDGLCIAFSGYDEIEENKIIAKLSRE